jgi:hypothetical protein
VVHIKSIYFINLSIQKKMMIEYIGKKIYGVPEIAERLVKHGVD